MTTSTSTHEADIEKAEQALREVLASNFRAEAPEAASSLDRILVHVTNMRPALQATVTCGANVAKRLKDFSVTTTRMAAKHPQSAAQLEKLTEALGAAGQSVAQYAKTAEVPRADAA